MEGIADLRLETTYLRLEMNQRFTELRGDMNVRFEDVNRRIGSLDAKVDRHFVWLVGITLTGFIALFGALLQVAFQ